MSDAAFAKCPCANCGLHLEFPIEAAGTTIDCPGCSQPTELASPEALPAPDSGALTIGEVLSAFGGPVPRARTSFLYQVGLIVVALTMVALPLIYLAMIGVVTWVVYTWATEFWPWLGTMRGGARFYVLKLIAYLGPLFAGVVLVLFMIKPLFAKRGPRAQPLALNPVAEPLLFAFIEQLCRTVGAPRPDPHRSRLPAQRCGGPAAWPVEPVRAGPGPDARPAASADQADAGGTFPDAGLWFRGVKFPPGLALVAAGRARVHTLPAFAGVEASAILAP